jgi:hypothetical protein
MTGDFSLADLTSKKGWVRTRCDLRIWIPVPAGFPPETGLDRDTWAATMAGAWWEQSGLRYGPDMVTKLAVMLETLREDGFANFPCHQIWAHYRDFTLPPLPLHIGIWKMTGPRDQQLRALSGATDPDVIRPPEVTEYTTDALGTGFRTLRHIRSDSGAVCGMLGFAFRSEEFETDVQVTTGTPDLRQLHRATGDIETFVHGMSVYDNPERPA